MCSGGGAGWVRGLPADTTPPTLLRSECGGSGGGVKKEEGSYRVKLKGRLRHGGDAFGIFHL